MSPDVQRGSPPGPPAALVSFPWEDDHTLLLDNGSPGRGEGDQKDEGDMVLVLFSDRTEVAEAEYFREFESCTVRWTSRATTGPPHSLNPKVIEGIAGFLKIHHLDWDGS
jgi:hypothetical protein